MVSDKIKVIEDIPNQLISVKKVRRLTGILAAQQDHFSVFEKISSLLLTSKKEEQLRMDSKMLIGLKRSETLPIKPSATIKTGGRQTIIDILSGLGGSSKCRSSPGGRR